jgi:hypothetical protein
MGIGSHVILILPHARFMWSSIFASRTCRKEHIGSLSDGLLRRLVYSAPRSACIILRTDGSWLVQAPAHNGFGCLRQLSMVLQHATEAVKQLICQPLLLLGCALG